MSARSRAILMGLGLCVGGCLDLGGTWDPSATSATTTTASSSSTTTTTGTAGTSSGTSTSAETDGCSFMCPDILPEDCDVWTQDCPEGYKCMPWANDGGTAWNALKCSPVDRNPDGIGEPCMVQDNGVSGIDSCIKGTMCWDVDPETNKGICLALCAGSADDPICPLGHSCSITASGVLNLCLPRCDPHIQDCPRGDLCLPINGWFQCTLDASGELGAYGDPCENFNTCDPGLACLLPEHVPDCKSLLGCCSPFCDTSKPNTCPGDGQECIPWYEEGMAPPGFETVGVCGVPQP